MRQYILISLIVALLLPIALFAQFTYLSDEEYKQLNRQERKVYNQNLEEELIALQQRKADAIANDVQYKKEIEELRNKLAELNEEYQTVYNRILNSLEITTGDIEAARRKIDEFKRNIDNWNSLSDSELWKNAKAINQTIDEYNSFKQTAAAKAPDFRNDIVELDRKIVNLEANLKRARPKYYEDSYTVVKGDYLSKIAGYSFIYNDSSKWGIIYRANRDQIKDPNVIKVDQVLKIPRGLPDTWKVYKGECLWRIAAYPEVYGKGSEWPLIYRANQDQIKDPDLIYPNQIFRIPRD
ncbi:MAG: LysM peptidoglycan-binding domain-containing protein [Candidatus Cloacimonas sp.]|nr:LysM peptidoglycan-binding domain-containing protein [Candidatus Cloacimonadota bacterium]